MTTPPVPHPRRLAALAVAAALVGVGCSSPATDLEPIQADLQTQARAQAALVDRIAELEDLVETMSAAQGGSLVDLTDALEARAAEIEATLAELQASLAEELLAREDGDAVNAAALADLVDRIDGLQATLSRIDRDLKALRSDHELLRAEFDRHVDNHR